VGRPWGLLSLGVAIIAGSLSYLSASLNIISYSEVLPSTLAITGAWLLLQSLIKKLFPEAWEVEAEITAGWGIIVSAAGLAGFLNVRGVPLNILMAGLAAVVGFLAVLAALRTWHKGHK
jgi:hypothetical protein